MTFPDQHQPIDLKRDLVNLATYHKTDAVVLHVAYSQDNQVYRDGRIVAVDAATYAQYQKTQPNELVNKFGLTYAPDSSLWLHKKLADVIIDAAIDMHTRYHQFTIIMDALRTYESGHLMELRRPDLVEAKLLAPAGTSAHNRALAVDSKLFEMRDGALAEADEHGHLDDLDMAANNRFYNGKMSDAARANRLNRLQAWQRASVKNKLPIANLLAEFWDDRVPGSPSDMWRVLSCRALCIGADGNPKTNPVIMTLRTTLEALHDTHDRGQLNRQQFAEAAHAAFVATWNGFFTATQKQQLETLLGHGGGEAPALADFVFHEWLATIHDRDLEKFGIPAQAIGMPETAAHSAKSTA